ncbi:hypothetical protein PFISCL1PPCAC_9916, partial [Pristionchus fissidentatus]
MKPEKAAEIHRVSRDMVYSRGWHALQLLGRHRQEATSSGWTNETTRMKRHMKTNLPQGKRGKRADKTRRMEMEEEKDKDSTEEEGEMAVPAEYTFGEGSQAITLPRKELINVEGVLFPTSKSVLERVMDLDFVDDTKKREFIGTKQQFTQIVRKILRTLWIFGKANELTTLTLTERRYDNIPKDFGKVVKTYRGVICRLFDPITLISEDGSKHSVEIRNSPYTFGEGDASITVAGHDVVTVEGVVLPRSRNLLYQAIDLELVDDSKKRPFIGTKEEFTLKIKEIISIIGSPVCSSVLVSNLVAILVDGAPSSCRGRGLKRPPSEYQLNKYSRLITLLFDPITIVDSDGNPVEKPSESIALPPHTFGEGEQSITVPGEKLVTVEGVVLPRSCRILCKVIDLGVLKSSQKSEFNGSRRHFTRKIREIVGLFEKDIPLCNALVATLVDKTTPKRNFGTRLIRYQQLINFLLNPITIIPDESTTAVSDNEE